jgi:hypothetical protein
MSSLLKRSCMDTEHTTLLRSAGGSTPVTHQVFYNVSSAQSLSLSLSLSRARARALTLPPSLPFPPSSPLSPSHPPLYIVVVVVSLFTYLSLSLARALCIPYNYSHKRCLQTFAPPSAPRFLIAAHRTPPQAHNTSKTLQKRFKIKGGKKERGTGKY